MEQVFRLGLDDRLWTMDGVGKWRLLASARIVARLALLRFSQVSISQRDVIVNKEPIDSLISNGSAWDASYRLRRATKDVSTVGALCGLEWRGELLAEAEGGISASAAALPSLRSE